MALSDGNQSASYGATTNQDQTANPVIDGATKVPPQFGSFAVLCTAQGDAKQNNVTVNRLS